MKAKAIDLVEAIPVRPAQVRISIPSGKKALSSKLNGIGLGRKVTIEVTGRVCSSRNDDYGSELCLDLSTMEIEQGLSGQVNQMRNLRRY